MKKSGFTLAEVLIALGIIGVVAAITMPTFTASTANAKIGPSLATAVNSFEEANAALLQHYDTSSLTGVTTGALSVTVTDIQRGAVGNLNYPENTQMISDSAGGLVYAAALTDYLKGDVQTNGRIAVLATKSGPSYSLMPATASERNQMNRGINSSSPHKRYIGVVTIDINGTAKPNQPAQDQFTFGLFADGSLRPMGGHPSWNNVDNYYWNTQCPANAEPTNPLYCAGSIFENNMKVLYK